MARRRAHISVPNDIADIYRVYLSNIYYGAGALESLGETIPQELKDVYNRMVKDFARRFGNNYPEWMEKYGS